jgi:DNA-binding transcriptional regulator YiaG
MTDLMVDHSLGYRTEAVPSRLGWFLMSGTGQAAPGYLTETVVFTPLSHLDFIIFGESVVDRLVVANGLLFGGALATSSEPLPIVRLTQTEAPIPAKAQTAAQSAIAEIRSVSGLTNEEIAPLAGVSRRSIQAWLAGDSISARKEQRLRALVDAIRQLAGIDAKATRSRLLDRVPGNIRAYDLLAEGRFEQAVDLALGRYRGSPAPATPQLADLPAQLSLIEGRVELPREPLDRRFTRRIR